MEIEIITLVVKGSAKLTVPTDYQEQIQVRSKSVVFCRVFDLKLRGIHLTEILVILKVWVINGQYVINVSICEVELRCLPFPICREQGLYEFRFVFIQKYVGRERCTNVKDQQQINITDPRHTFHVPMGMPIIGRKPFPANTTKMLSTRNSTILMMYFSVYMLFELECSFTK